MEEKTALNAEVPEALRRRVKSNAALEGLTASEFVSRALEHYVDELERARAAKAGAQ